MAKTKLTDLQAAANQAAASGTASEKIEALSRAFKLFSEETQRLEEAHRELTENFEHVNQELEQTNRRLKQKLRELDTSTSYLRHILSNISQGLLFINKAKIITTFNKSAEVILSKPAMEVLFQPFLHNFSDTLFGFSVAEALAQREAPSTSSTRLQVAPGVVRELEVEARYVSHIGGAELASHLDPTLDYTEGLIILVRDVTEMRRLKLLTERNNRLKALGEMAAMVAHEIRNPLGGIKGFASLLRRDLQEQPHLQEMANYIVEGTDALNRLVTHVLNYARPVKPEFATTDLKKLLTDIRTRVQYDEHLCQGITIVVEAERDHYSAAVDAQLIQGVMLNLVVNAIEAMPNGGKVTLALEQAPADILVKVIDTGSGIKEEDLTRIFSPFFTTKPQGNGFGLSEVYKVIQAHSGTIEVTSTVGKGTMFTIKLPQKQAF